MKRLIANICSFLENHVWHKAGEVLNTLYWHQRYSRTVSAGMLGLLYLFFFTTVSMLRCKSVSVKMN